MRKEELKFVDDKLFVYAPALGHGNVCRVQLVMTKEIFQECYKRWIKSPDPQERSDKE